MNTNEGQDDLVLLAQRYANGELEAECDDEAFQQCKLVGEKGGAKVLYFLGMCYHFGCGTSKNLKVAVECYIRAAELGSFEALERLWDLEDNDQSVQINIQDAFRGFCEKSEQKDARAQFNAGFCYYWGIGTPQSRSNARDLFWNAADQGCADAMYMLDRCRQRGLGDGYNGMQGIELLRYAAEMGSAEAQYQLGYVYWSGETIYGLKVEEDNKQAADWWQKAVDQNYSETIFWLAFCYCRGLVVQEDIKKAFQLYKKTALMRNKHAQNEISKFYSHQMPELSKDEYPISIDYFEAAYWNRKAVDQDKDFAKKSMPDILNLIELTQDQIDELMKQTSSFESAKTWYDIARQYETGDAVEKDEKKAFEMYKLAARFGSIPANVALGRCYKSRIGVKKDLKQAIHWYEKAAMQGNHEAAAYLLNLIQSESTIITRREGSPFADLAECYQTGSGIPGMKTQHC